MKKKLIFLFIGFLLGTFQVKAEVPLVVKGEIDFLNRSLQKKSSTEIVGQWSFYWNRWLSPTEFINRAPDPDGFLKVPGLWNSFTLPQKKGKKVGPIGVSTYAVKVKNLRPSVPLSLYLRSASSAYRIYLVDKNGVKDFGTMGKPSLKKEEMVSWWMPKIFNFGITSEEFYIVVHMSNFIYGKGGLWMPPKLGPTKKIHKDFQFRLIRDFFIMGIFFIMAIYHFALYSLRKNDLANLSFGLFCLTMGLRAFVSDLYVFYFTDNLSNYIFKSSIKFEYVSQFLILFFLPNFFSYIFKDYFSERLLKVITIFSAVMITTVIIIPVYYFYYVLQVINLSGGLLFLFCIIQLLRAARKRVEFSIFFLLLIFFCLILLLNDILIAMQVLNPPYLLPYGFVCFIFIQSYILATKSSLAFKTAEKLGQDLEKEVNKKTVQIESQYKDFKTLLFNLEQGFLVFDSEGLVKGDSTNITKDLFQTDPKSKKMDEILRLNKNESKNFRSWLTHIFRGLVPFKDLLSLAPKEFSKVEGKIIALNFRPLYENEDSKKIEKVICIATDITEKKDLEEKSKTEREKVEMINSLLERPLEFLDLLAEADDLFDVISSNTKAHGPEGIFRVIHTLKARFSSYKIKEVSGKIHELESILDEMRKDDKWGDKEVKKVNESILKIHFKLKEFMSENRKLVELANNSMKTGDDGGDLQRIKNELLTFYNSVSKNLILKNIRDSFSQFVGPSMELAKAQDKLVEINIAESNIYINPERYKSFFSGLLHVFRNAVDHGIESREERKETGKNTTASIDVSFKEVGISRFKILIKDDGRGIDADKIREKVKDTKGLESEGIKDEEVIQFIFESGLSTREEASEISGRGVGMDVVKKEIEKMDGSVFVESAVNEGTLFIIELPILK